MSGSMVLTKRGGGNQPSPKLQLGNYMANTLVTSNLRPDAAPLVAQRWK